MSETFTDLRKVLDLLEADVAAREQRVAAAERDIAGLTDEVARLRARFDGLPPTRDPDPPAATPIWQDDFAGNWRGRWPLRWSEPDNKYARHEYFVRDGETWMRVIYPPDKLSKGMKFATKHPRADQLYVQYRVRFADDFDWVLGGKLPGLYAGSVRPRVRPDGTDGWLARLMWLSGGRGIAYVYHPDMPGAYGENIHFNGPRFQRGKIHTIGCQVVLNTPRAYDGILRVWLDDALVVERTDMRWRDVPELAIDGISFSTFFGGNTADWAPKKDERAEFGGFRLFAQNPL